MKKEGHFALVFKKTVAIVKSPRYPGRQSSPDAAAREVNQKYGIPADATVFLFVGRINFIKNIDFTVRALARAKELAPPTGTSTSPGTTWFATSTPIISACVLTPEPRHS